MVPVLLAIVTWSMICLGTSLYCAYFLKLIYCRQKIIYTSTLVEDLYYKKNPFAKYDKSFPQASIATLKDLALEQHRVSFLSGSTEIHQWNGHSSRFAYFVSSLWPWLLTAAGFTILSPLFSDFFLKVYSIYILVSSKKGTECNFTIFYVHLQKDGEYFYNMSQIVIIVNITQLVTIFGYLRNCH